MLNTINIILKTLSGADNMSTCIQQVRHGHYIVRKEFIDQATTFSQEQTHWGCATSFGWGDRQVDIRSKVLRTLLNGLELISRDTKYIISILFQRI